MQVRRIVLRTQAGREPTQVIEKGCFPLADSRPKLSPFSGAQGSWKIPKRPEPIPEAIRQLPAKVEQRRGRDVWRAAQRLQVAAFAWAHFLSFGAEKARLDDPTEAVLIAWFPELENIGRVLNLWADEVTWPEKLADRIRENDPLANIKRSPTDRHKVDDVRESCRAVQPLLDSFRGVLIAEADCLCRHEINSKHFGRPWDEIRSEIQQFTSSSGDWTGKVPQLLFKKMIAAPAFGQVYSRLMCELEELLNQLRQYPEAVLSRPAMIQPASATPPRSGRRMTKKEAESHVKDHLSREPNATSNTIALAIGCSDGLVRGTDTWKNRPSGRERRTEKRTLGKEIGFDMAVESLCNEEYKTKEREQQQDDEETGSLTKEEQIKRLSAEQEQDDKSG